MNYLFVFFAVVVSLVSSSANAARVFQIEKSHEVIVNKGNKQLFQTDPSKKLIFSETRDNEPFQVNIEEAPNSPEGNNFVILLYINQQKEELFRTELDFGVLLKSTEEIVEHLNNNDFNLKNYAFPNGDYIQVGQKEGKITSYQSYYYELDLNFLAALSDDHSMYNLELTFTDGSTKTLEIGAEKFDPYRLSIPGYKSILNNGMIVGLTPPDKTFPKALTLSPTPCATIRSR